MSSVDGGAPWVTGGAGVSLLVILVNYIVLFLFLYNILIVFVWNTRQSSSRKITCTNKFSVIALRFFENRPGSRLEVRRELYDGRVNSLNSSQFYYWITTDLRHLSKKCSFISGQKFFYLYLANNSHSDGVVDLINFLNTPEIDNRPSQSSK